MTLAESLVRFRGVLEAEAGAGAALLSVSRGERARLRFLRDPLRFLENYTNNRFLKRIVCLSADVDVCNSLVLGSVGLTHRFRPQ